MTDVEDDLATIQQGLEADGYYVHPSLRSQFDADDLAAISAGLDDTVAPAYVVAWPLRPNDEYGGNGVDLLTRLHQQYDEPGTYLVTTSEDYYEYARIEGRQWDVPGQSDGSPYEVLSTVGYEEPATLGDAFARAVELLALPPEELREVNDTARDDSYDTDTGSSTGSSGGGDGGDVAGGVVATGVVLAVVLVVAVVLTARRRRRAKAEAKPAFELPAATLTHLRAARDRELRERARSEVAALGRDLDATTLAEQRAPVSWQHALDHHAAAEKILEEDDPPTVADAVGAIVLARRGSEALAATRAGRSWSPSPGCYLDPLHEGSVERHAVAAGAGAVEAPLCGRCRDDVDDGREPDTFDVEHDGRVRPYFETTLEPWATTGYGAIDLDLVGALHGGRR